MFEFIGQSLKFKFVDDEKVTSIDTFVDEAKLADGGFVIVKKGKKVFHKITK